MFHREFREMSNKKTKANNGRVPEDSAAGGVTSGGRERSTQKTRTYFSAKAANGWLSQGAMTTTRTMAFVIALKWVAFHAELPPG
uniref:Uncharacterized protein n=1 Tax=Vespula pensylvanica TaxID=30213 RepID=A0A834K8R5_VESPE|nr:hypothetical protein H0235_015537 [Vespula pensylvanica]